MVAAELRALPAVLIRELSGPLPPPLMLSPVDRSQKLQG
jgi:hypothetical protein